MIYYISGHLNITEAEFFLHYEPWLTQAFRAGHAFVIGDAMGADTRAQTYLAKLGAKNVTIYHMLEKPRTHFDQDWPAVGGYLSDEERDAAMTAVSNKDIAWVRPGREDSGTARNLKRRNG